MTVGKRAAKRKKLYGEVLAQEERLAGEMNLRLLLEQPLDGKVLFVEELAVTDICFPAKNKRRRWRKDMDHMENIFSEKAVNRGRQRELDLAKAICAFFLAFIHCMIECTPEPQLGQGIPYLFDSVIGGPLSAPMFMFAMGVGMAYTTRDTPGEYARRGLCIGVIGYLLNVCRFLIPWLIGYRITGEREKYIAPLAYRVLGNDILQFAALAMLLMALLFKLRVPGKAIFLLSLGMSLAGTWLRGTDMGSPAGNIFMGYFIGTEDAAGMVISDFPLLNWFPAPVSGYLFGRGLQYVRNKKRFYGLFSTAAALAAAIYFTVGISRRWGMFGEGQNCYYHISTWDCLASLAAAVAVLGICYVAAERLPRRALSLVGGMSRNVNAIYCIHWVLVAYSVHLGLYILRGTQTLPVAWTLLLSLCVSLASTGIALFVSRVRRIFSDKRNGRGKRHGGLAGKALGGLSLMAVLLALCTGLSVGAQYLREKMDEYTRIAFSYARTAAEYIDGDRVLSYLETGRQDAYYRQIQQFLNASQKQTDLKYYYVFVPCEDDLVYIWDADHQEGACPLGWHEEYMIGGKEAVRQIYRQDPPEKISITNDAAYGYIASAFYPLFDSAGEPVAVVGVDMSVPELERELIRFLCIILCSVAGVILLSMVFFYGFIRGNIINPVRQLNRAARELVGGLEKGASFCPDIHTGDEIEEVADAFGKMSVELRDYIHKLSRVTAEKERIGAELDVAAHIQSSLLPCVFPAFPDREELDIYATMDPAREVGGDFYDFFPVDERHLAIVVADVSGKGVPAALFMAIGKTLIKDHTLPGKDLGEVFARVNDLLCASNGEGLFITAFEAVLDLETGELRYVNAGHETPFICRRGGILQPWPVSPGFVLAGMEGTVYQAGSMRLFPGDKLFQYTDGVTEATDQHGELYGMERLAGVLERHAHMSPDKLLPAVKEDIDAFVGETPQFDDITMLCLEYRGPQPVGEGGRDMERQQKILVVDAVVENIEKVTEFVDGHLKHWGCPAKTRTQIDIAIDELFGNIARYAYRMQPGVAAVQVETAEEPRSVTVTFTDSGVPFDPLEKADPDITLAAEKRPAGGLGIYMVKQSMDEVSYERKEGKNILRIRKNL